MRDRHVAKLQRPIVSVPTQDQRLLLAIAPQPDRFSVRPILRSKGGQCLARYAGCAEIHWPRTHLGLHIVADLQFRKPVKVIDFAKAIPQNAVTNRLISQLVGAAASVGANYVEADDAVSKKEFLKNIGTCRKEARETKHFLRMVVRAVPELKPQARVLWIEAKELHLIFSKIWRSKT